MRCDSRATGSMAKGRSQHAIASAAAAAVLDLLASPVRAGNVDSFYLGNQAALQAGAVTANAELGSAIWYNPAGLARAQPTAVDASATAFTLSLGRRVDLDSSFPGAQTTRLESIAFAIVPASITAVRRWGRFGVGLGLFVPHQESVALRTRVVLSPGSSPGPNELSIDINSREQAYYGGPAFGVSLSPLLDIGGALFVRYSNSLDISALAASGAALGPDAGTILSHMTTDTQSIGLLPTLGLQFHPGSGWRTGLSLELPSQRIYRQEQTVNMLVSPSPLDAATTSLSGDFDEEVGFAGGRVTPWRLDLGVARELSWGHVAIDASFRQPLRDDELGVEQRAVINARLGGVMVVDERVTLGGGLFTDRSPDRLATSSEGRQLDYYGVSLGLQHDTRYAVAEPERSGVARFQDLIFRTTAVFTYAVGFGRIERLDLALGDDGAPVLLPRRRDVVEHQLILHVGSTLLD